MRKEDLEKLTKAELIKLEIEKLESGIQKFKNCAKCSQNWGGASFPAFYTLG